MYRFDFGNYHPAEPKEVRFSIQEVAHSMSNPPINNMGSKAILKVGKTILSWPDYINHEALCQACFNVYIFIDAADGDDRGIFHYMNGCLSKETFQITEAAELVEK